MIEKEPYFIDDPDVKDRNYFLKEFSKTIDSNGYRKKVFLREFLLAIIKSHKKAKRNIVPKIKFENINPLRRDLTNVRKIRPIRFPIPAQFIPPTNEIIRTISVKKLPYPQPKPIYQLKPVIRRSLKRKKLPYLKSKNKDVFLEGGKIYYMVQRRSKDYLDQVKNILSDPAVNAVYVDGVNKPLLVDYAGYSQLSTKIEFSDVKKLNNMVKKFAKENGIKIDDNNPVFLERLKDGSLFQGRLGDDFIEPGFAIKK